MKGNSIRLQDVYPIMEFNDECIISKCADITIAYKLQFPPLYSLSEDDSNFMRDLFSRAFNCFSAGTIILKQDIYFKTSYKPQDSNWCFLIKSYEDHFAGREYLKHCCILYFTLPHKNRRDISSLQSILCRKNILMGKSNEETLQVFLQEVEQAVNILSSDSRLISLKKMDSQQLQELTDQYLSFTSTPVEYDFDYTATPSAISIANRQISNLSISSLEDLPLQFEENVPNRTLSTDSTTLHSSILSRIGYNIPTNHVVNQYIKILDNDKYINSLKHRSRFLRSFSTLSSDNALNHEMIEEYIEQTALTKGKTIQSSIQILVEETQHIKDIITALGSEGIKVRLNSYNTPAIYWAGIPGNAADLGKEEYFSMPLANAVALSSLESSDRGIEGGSFAISDRLTHIPLALDMSAIAMDKGLITNYNIFTLGPSGSGKSFLTNEYLTQSYYKDDAHCVVIDQGNSYFPLCQIIQEESGGEDGIYYDADKYPFSFNPFLNATSQEDKTFLLSLIYCIWKKETSTAAEDSLLSDAINQYLDKENKSMDGFRSFLAKEWIPTNQTEIKDTAFAATDLLTALKQFCGRGKYSKLLNNKENIDLTTKRFILFEIDNISSDKTLFPIVTLLITKLFADKMKRVPQRKIMLIEEAWRAIASPQMEGWIQWLWKTARKHNAQAMVVTQEVEDIISSAVVKNAIINNSAIRILLDQRTLKDRYDDIASILALNNHDKNLIFSINKDLNHKYRYREAYISIGSHKGIYALETSRQAYWAYTTKRSEQIQLQQQVANNNSYIDAIISLTS